MQDADALIFAAVIDRVSRYGMKRATMADLAQAAGVSRQTLYDRFGDKDGIMAAAIAHMSQDYAQKLRVAFAANADLPGKLDAYFDIAVWPTFEVMQTMPDAADFETGMGPLSSAATTRMRADKQAILAEMLAPHLDGTQTGPEHVAQFLEQSAHRAKMSGIARADLAQYLSTLRSAVMALARAA